MRFPLGAVLLLALLVPHSGRAASPKRAPVDVRASRDARGHAGVLFTFPRHSLEVPRAPLTVQEVRAFIAVFDAVYGRQKPLPPVAFPGPLRMAAEGMPVSVDPPGWQRRVRDDVEALCGTGRTDLLPPDYVNSPFVQALLLSPKYMAEGVREAAMELFTSPTFLASLSLSLVLYMAALAAPEPFFSKGTVAALTLYLMWTYGVTEVLNVARAVVTLYQEAHTARTLAELEQAAQHFGVKMGGVELRVAVTVALAGLAGKRPEVPRALGGGGLWTQLGAPQGALMSNVTYEGMSVVRMTASGTGVVLEETAVAETSLAKGTVFLMGAVLGTEAATATAASQEARTTGGCREDNSQGDAPEHHIATNKNHTAEVRGGPWTPKLELLFRKVGMDFEHPANKIFVIGHKGPHPEEYHKAVYYKLLEVFIGCATPQDCKTQFVDALDKLAKDICEPGSRLNQLITKKP